MQQNLVGLGGNGKSIAFPLPSISFLNRTPPFFQSPAGTYGTGPFHGKLVDARGPRPSLAMGFFSLLIGYMGIKAIFDIGLKDGQEQAPTAIVILLIFCGFLTGSGGSGATSGSLNTVAKSFPEHLVSTRDIFHKSCRHANALTLVYRGPVLQRWYYLGLGSRPSCSRQSPMRSSPATPLTSSLFWQLALRCR